MSRLFLLYTMFLITCMGDLLNNDVEYRRYQSAGHGFGLGTGTDAEGWLDLAVQFWQRHTDE